MSSKMNRRTLLKGLTMLPLGSLLPAHAYSGGTDAPANPRAALHVYCHGLYAYVFYEDHILLLTPRIDEHKYLAGEWRKEKDLELGASYSLTGVTDSVRPNSRPGISHHNLFLSSVKRIDLTGSYCQVRLPFPTQFLSLRYVKASLVGNDLLASGDTAQMSEFPLLQVLRYEVPDPRKVRLENFDGWNPVGDSQQQLHFFAEPLVVVPDDHASRAFKGFKQIFPDLDLRLQANSIPSAPLCPPPPDPNDKLGLQTEEEKSLAERDRACPGELVAKLPPGVTGPVRGKPRGPQPGNCFSIIVNAPQ